MKYFNTLVLTILVLTLIIGGCAKDELPSKSETKHEQQLTEPINNNSAGDSRAAGFRTLYFWVDVFYDLWTGETHTWDHVIGCFWPSTNCLKTHVVHARSSTAEGSSTAGETNSEQYEKFESHVDEETTNLYFSGTDYKAFVPEIDSLPEVLANLRNGDLKFIRWQNQRENDNSYFIAFDRDLPDSLCNESAIKVAFEFIHAR